MSLSVWQRRVRRAAATSARAFSSSILPASVAAIATAGTLALVHQGQAASASQLLRDALLLLPLALVACALGLRMPARLDLRGTRADAVGALASGLLLAIAVGPAVGQRGFLVGGDVATGDGMLVYEGAVALGATVVALALLRIVPWVLARPLRVALASGVAVLALVGAIGGPALSAGRASAPSLMPSPRGCTIESAARSYEVSAINLRIPLNRWGDAIEQGMAYVLDDDRAAVENWARPLAANPADDPAGNRRLRPRPLVIRANAGECVHVHFTNRLKDNQDELLPSAPRVGMHISGVAYDAQTSDGGNVGYNDDSTVANRDDVTTPGHENQIDYLWVAPRGEGLFVISDGGVLAGGEADGGSTAMGLYGALAVEPEGSVWTDGSSGRALYTDTKTQSGDLYINAIIDPPSAPAFRETIQLSQDEIPNIGFGFDYGSEPQVKRDARACADCVGEETSLSSWTYGDPALIKLASGNGPWLTGPDHKNAEDCGLEESCYVANVAHTYIGDQTKIRFAHVGVKETHVFHLHAHQWLAQPDDVGPAGTIGGGADAASQVIDSQTYGPGESFTADLLYGAGSRNGTFGDSIFHCHLYPHFADGFWSLLRVHDVMEDGTGLLPDGTGVRRLAPLPDRPLPPTPTADNPGYPRMIPGKPGWRAPQPPSITEPDGSPAQRVVAGKELTADDTAVERAVQQRIYGGKPAPLGAPFRDPCPADARHVRYDVAVIQTDVVYNERGDHDPQARVLVLKRDVADVLAGRKQAEPLFFRVNAGDCIDYSLTNMVPNWMGGDAYIQVRQTNMIGEHIHLVKFDVTASDGSSNGWNYQGAAFSRAQSDFNRDVTAGRIACPDTPRGCLLKDPTAEEPLPVPASPGQTIHERWYADYELNTVFTHDHHFAAIDQNRGLFGALVVEPKGFDVRDPFTGEYFQPINDPAHGTPCGDVCEAGAAGGTVDLIGPSSDDDFREFGLGFQDFVSLVKKGGDIEDPDGILNPPRLPEAFPDDDPGVMAISYRNAPLAYRQSDVDGHAADPGHAFSSAVWGDPWTPLLEAYAGDAVRMRVIQGSQEEQHVFTLHGTRWRKEPNDPQSRVEAAKEIGISEAFNVTIPSFDCAFDDPCRGDYLYSSGAIDDLWLGMWGLMRVHGFRESRLLPLPDNQPPAAPPLEVARRLARAIRSVDAASARRGARQLAAVRSAAREVGLAGARLRPLGQRSTLAPARRNVIRASAVLRGLGRDLARPAARRPAHVVILGRLRTARRALVSARRALVSSRSLAGASATPRRADGHARQVVPPKAAGPGAACPAGAPVRQFDVVALDLDLVYNEAGDHDPRGLMYALAGDEAALRSGSKAPEPLVLRVNEGDCIDVTLANHIDETWAATNSGIDGDPSLPLESEDGTPAGLRVSLHPQLLKYDIRFSDGTAIGLNPDGTAGPGESVRYRWYADDVEPGELGTVPLTDFGDVRSHRSHGLMAALVVEPKDATWHDPQTGAELRSGARADIRVPGQPDFREQVLFFQDGLNLLDFSGQPIADIASHPPTPEEPIVEPLDAEDEGEKGFNYKNAPFRVRLGIAPGKELLASADAWSQVLSSRAHGDPETPVLRAYEGDPVRIRIVHAGAKPRQHAFTQSGAAFHEDAGDPESPVIDTIGGIAPTRTDEARIDALTNLAGDYRYYCRVAFGHQSGGLWGITRVYARPADADALVPTALGAVDDPRAGGHPIMPLELDTIVVAAFGDRNGNGRRDAGERSLPGVAVTVATAGAGSTGGATGGDGTVALGVRAGSHRLALGAPSGFRLTTPGSVDVTTTGDNDHVQIAVGLKETV